MNIRFLTLTALLCGVFFLANCSGGAAPTTTANSNTATVTNNKPADVSKPDAPKADAPKTETASTDSVGVPECDEYIRKYEACLTKISKQAPQVEPTLKSAFQQQRDGFKQLAANPQSKGSLASACKQAVETAKASTTSAYQCEW